MKNRSLGLSLLVAWGALNLLGAARHWIDRAEPGAARAVQEPAEQASGAAVAEESDDGPLFEGWSKPDFALLISGRQDGYIEPCGCTGLANQKGGMLRRGTLLAQLRDERGWAVAGVDTGNQVRRTGPQAVIKMMATWKGLFESMPYRIGSFGPDDLKIPSFEVIGGIVRLNLAEGSPFVCANLLFSFDEQREYCRRTRVFEIGGRRVGVTAVLGKAEIEELRPYIDTDYVLSDVDAALQEASAELAAARCDVTVLIANASIEESREMVRRFPNFDLAVVAGGIGEPTRDPERIETGDRSTRLILVGSKGMYAGVIGGWLTDGKLDLRYQRVPLDARFGDFEPLKAVFSEYQAELSRMTFEQLNISPKEHPSNANRGDKPRREFVGSQICQDCHEYEYDVWAHGHEGPDNPDRIGAHVPATADLLLNPNGERTWVTREHDPECLSCHVTGWNPQGYFPYETGYRSIADEALHGNGCENCHGPGSAHVTAEEDDVDGKEVFAREMVVTMKEARQNLCLDCHDLDNSPDFHNPGAFEKYWEQIDHSKRSRKR